MFLGVSSPIVDVFAAGGLPLEVRLLAARGLATSADLDRLALLALLVGDDDPDVAALANATLDALPAHALDEFLGRDEVPAELRAYFARRATDRASEAEAVSAAAEVLQPGSLAPDVTSPDAGPGVEDRDAASPDASSLAEAPSESVVAAIDQAAETLGDDDVEEVHQLLTSLPVPDKIKLATLGRREQRAILIRDPNRIVSTAVLASPKLTETEVEMFARMQNVSEEVLRIIGMSRVWVKSYNIIAALVKNPRTPTAVSLPLLSRLQERDVKGLTVNRNLPESVRLAAKKFMAVQQERRGG